MSRIDTTHAFDGKADDYARNRFDYSRQAIDAIVAVAGLDKSSAIADLGAGTGMLARHFADRVRQVFAVEPNEDMRALATTTLAGIDSLRVVNGFAHDTGLPDGSVDAVTAGRAIQWFDPVPSRAEIRRILRPGGWLIVVRTPVTDAYSSAALDRLRAACAQSGVRTDRHRSSDAAFLGYFDGPNHVRLSYPSATRETWPQFLGRIRSLSFTPQPDDPAYASFERLARELFDRGAVDGHLQVEYATEVLMKQMTPAAASSSIPFSEREIEGDIVTRFEHIAATVPANLAVRAGDGEWTYAALDALANAIAQIVLRESPDRARPVALLFDHGVAGIAAMLGVLKSGRACCALSVANPIERQRESLSDLQASLLLCEASQRSLAETIAESGVQCVTIDPNQLQGDARRPEVERSADDVAAVYYTSGTTGKPKGVALSHRYFLHRVWLCGPMFRIAPGDRMSQIPALSFVTAATDVVMALLLGATLCPFDATRNGLARLAAWLNRERIAIVRLPVALFNQFLESLRDADRFPHVRFIHPAGKLHWQAVDRYRRHFSRECRLVRQLAATETSVVAMMMIDHDTPRAGLSVPVGYPVAGKELWLEREDGARVHEGEIGEIVVRSPYLFSGIWRNPDTFAPRGESRVHRMRDLGRWLPDGSLEFVGRTDARAKVRGFTVDLEQIEAAIADTGAVVDAAVVAREESSGDAHLVAYIVPRGARGVANEIRARLGERVPDYMIPARFVELDTLPLTPTGKLDRAALPALGRDRPESARSCIAPRTPLEERVTAIWKEALAIDSIGIEDDFLDLGGDSLRATRIASRILAALEVELSPRDVFLAANVAKLSELIAHRQAQGSDAHALPPSIVRQRR